MFNAKAVLFALTAVSAVLADHQITVVNNCSSGKNAHVKNANWNHVSGLLGVGDKYSVSVPALGTPNLPSILYRCAKRKVRS